MPKNQENLKRLRREHYYRNREHYISQAYIRTQKVKLEIRTWLAEYLLDHPCVDCGESDLVTLDFDHIDPSTKLFDMGSAVTYSKSMKSVIAEVAKCDVRCANCHKKMTSKQFGWFKATYISPRFDLKTSFEADSP